MLHIHPHIRHVIQKIRPHLHAHFHGVHGIAFIRTACIYLKGHFLIAVKFLHVRQCFLADGIKAVILQTHSGADGMQPEDSFQLGNGKIIIQFAIAIFHNQATGVTHNIIVTVRVEIFANRGNQAVDEDIFIIAAHGNLTVFHD